MHQQITIEVPLKLIHTTNFQRGELSYSICCLHVRDVSRGDHYPIPDENCYIYIYMKHNNVRDEICYVKALNKISHHWKGMDRSRGFSSPNSIPLSLHILASK